MKHLVQYENEAEEGRENHCSDVKAGGPLVSRLMAGHCGGRSRWIGRRNALGSGHIAANTVGVVLTGWWNFRSGNTRINGSKPNISGKETLEK